MSARARVAGWLVLSGALGCTVGDGGNGTLSGGASASASASVSASTTASSEATGNDDDDATDDAGTGDGGSSPSPDTGDETDAPADSGDGVDSSDESAGSSSDAGSSDDGAGSSSGSSDFDDGILGITFVAHNDCTITTMPASITVPEGTAFTVEWISAASSEIEADVAKIDPFNAVPIIIGMEPGTSYHDEVREWCGDLFTGTFDFRITSCADPQYIPVDCGG